jgi:hypothetical protein
MKEKFLEGTNLEFHLNRTFGDLFYIGLNEIEIFDQNGSNLLQNQKFTI